MSDNGPKIRHFPPTLPLRSPEPDGAGGLPGTPAQSVRRLSPVDLNQQFRDFERAMTGERAWPPHERRGLVISKGQKGAAGLRYLRHALEVEQDPMVREAVLHALAVAGGAPEAKRLYAFARTGEPDERRGAFRGLQHLLETVGASSLPLARGKDSAKMLTTVCRSAPAALRAATTPLLGSLGVPGFRLATSVLKNPLEETPVRTAAATALRTAAPAVVAEIGKQSVPEARAAIAESLRAGVHALCDAADSASESTGLRLTAITALSECVRKLRRTPEHALAPLTTEDVSAFHLALEALYRREPDFADAVRSWRARHA